LITQTRTAATQQGMQTMRRTSLWQTITGSVAIWLIAWLVAADFCAAWLKPLRYVDTPSVILEDQDPLDDKVQALSSQHTHFNILMLGSSLLAATSSADFVRDSSKDCHISLNFYTRSRTLDGLLNGLIHIPAKSFNMGIAACMVDEDRLLLEKALREGKKPKMLLLLLAPRDFLDNTHGHVFKYLQSKRPFWEKLNCDGTPQQIFERAALSISIIYARRGQYMQVLEQMVCGWLHRAPNLFYASRGPGYWEDFSAPKFTLRHAARTDISASQTIGFTASAKSLALKKMLSYYRNAYLPLNHDRMTHELQSLNKLLDEATQNKILTVVVNMPRGSLNEALLPADFACTYKDMLRRTCQAHAVKFTDFQDNPEFSDEDYTDGVHLSPKGSAKFYTLLSTQLAANPQFCSQARLAFDVQY
jgi:hypothetical protein